MTDIAVWSETDASNNAAAPAGFPEGMLPSGVNDGARALMGATKRFWDRVNGTLLAGGVANAYTLTYGVNDASLYQGAVYTFRAPAANTGASTLNVNDGTGAHPIVRNGSTATEALSAFDIVVGGYYSVAWDSVSTQFVLLGGMPAGQGGFVAALHSVSACLTSEIASLSVATAAALRSTSVVIKADLASVSAAIKADIASVSAAITTAFVAADRSTSVVIKADIASVSAAITTAFVAADRSTSVVIKADIASVSAAITTAFAAADRSTSVVIKADLASVSGVIAAQIASLSACIGSAWTTFTPSVTAQPGVITSVSLGTNTYKKLGSTVVVNYNVEVTDNGTGGSIAGDTYVAFRLPIDAAVLARNGHGSGREEAITGSMLQLLLHNTDVSLVKVRTYNNAYPVQTGSRIVGNFIYEVVA